MCLVILTTLWRDKVRKTGKGIDVRGREIRERRGRRKEPLTEGD